jgi:hypothetical protein
MTLRGCEILFQPLRSAALAAVLALPACASATIEDAVPQSTATAGPIDTGTYPNLNIVPVAATEQLTEAERAAKTAELQAARQGIPAGDAGAASSDPQLRKIAATHAEDALRQIEGE